MLAVIEHIEPKKLPFLMKEIIRVLKPNGRVIITTPERIVDYPLKIMAGLRMASRIEVYDHKKYYNKSKIFKLFKKVGFNEKKIKSGHFEFFLNIWAYAIK